jgi:PDZ domain
MKPAALVLSLALLTPLPAADPPPPAPDNEVLVLDPFKVHGTPTNSFSFALQILITTDTKKVARIFITKVLPGDAQDLGLQPGDEILKIDGLPVEGMDSRLNPSSLLGRTLINRRPGDPLKLEVRIWRTKEVTVHALREVPWPLVHP